MPPGLPNPPDISSSNAQRLEYWQRILGYPRDYVDRIVRDYENSQPRQDSQPLRGESSYAYVTPEEIVPEVPEVREVREVPEEIVVKAEPPIKPVIDHNNPIIHLEVD